MLSFSLSISLLISSFFLPHSLFLSLSHSIFFSLFLFLFSHLYLSLSHFLWSHIHTHPRTCVSKCFSALPTLHSLKNYDSMRTVRGRPPVLFVYILLVCLHWINNIITCFIQSEPGKQKVSRTVILSLTKLVGILWSDTNMEKAACSNRRNSHRWRVKVFLRGNPILDGGLFFF